MKVSSGYIKEITVLILMETLIKIEEDKAVEVPLGQTDEELDLLHKEIIDYIASQPKEVLNVAYKRAIKHMPKIFNVMPKNISPDLLALYVLHINFNERLGTPLAKPLLSFQRNYLDMAEILCTTRLGELEGDMFTTSLKILEIIKD